VIALFLLLASFPHQPHLETAKLACLECHVAPAKFGAEVGYPTVAKCALCHPSIDRQTKIPAARTLKLADFVYFDHRMHLNNGVNCEDCHAGGGAANAAAVTMKFCQTCHVKMRAAAGCGTCHDAR
jgi:hypothetical protein